jgi:hypothetical protein
MGVRKMVPIGDVLYEDVPSLTVTERNQLPCHDPELLAADAGNLAISPSAALAAMAARAPRSVSGVACTASRNS